MPRGVYERIPGVHGRKPFAKKEQEQEGIATLQTQATRPKSESAIKLLPERAASLAEAWIVDILEVVHFNLMVTPRFGEKIYTETTEYAAGMERALTQEFLPHLYGDIARKQVTFMCLRKEAAEQAIRHYENTARSIEEKRRGIIRVPPMER